MSTSTNTGTGTDRPTVEAVLRAVDRGALLSLLPEPVARPLLAPIARLAAGVELDAEARTAAARALQACAGELGPALAMMGVEIPTAPAPVTPAVSHSGTDRPPMVWLVAGGYLAVAAPFALSETIRALPGHGDYVKPVPGKRAGYHPFPATPAAAATVLAALEPFGPKVSAGVVELAARQREMLAARGVLDDDAPVPEADGTAEVNMTLWPHQRRFVEYGQASAGMCFAVTMGGGKTGAAIALVNRERAARVLIVCPNRVRRVWVREVSERSAIPWHIEDGTRPAKRRGGRKHIDMTQPERVPHATATLFDCACGAPVHAYVVNYEALAESVWQRWEPAAPLDMIIYDEGHRLKGQKETHRRKVKGLSIDELKARKAKDLPKYTLSGIAGQWRANARKVVALTGTPMPQHPWDIFGLYRALDPGIFGLVWDRFCKEYCDMDRGGTFPVRIKRDKLDEFATKVASIMYRPIVDLKLPGFTKDVRYVELEPEARVIYDQLDTELWTDLTAMLARREAEREAAARRAAGLSPIEPARRVDLDGMTCPTHEQVPDPTGDCSWCAGRYDTGSDTGLDSGGDGQEYVPADGAPVELTAANILSRLLRLQQLTGGTLRGDPEPDAYGRPIPGPAVVVSTAKVDELADVLDEVGCVKGGADGEGDPEPVTVFTRFTADLAAVRKLCVERGLRYGEISGERDDGLDAGARMNPDIDVCGVNIQAGGTGIDLTRSNVVVWYSLGYSVSNFDQAKARNYRPGQTRPVRNIHIICRDAMDEAVYEAIDERRAAVSEVLVRGGVDPRAVGVVEVAPGPDPLAAATTDSKGAQVRFPWE